MSKKPVKDVFGLWQIEHLKSSDFCGKYQLPHIYGTSCIPKELVQFSKHQKFIRKYQKKKYEVISESAVHFYEFDEKFVKCFENKGKLIRKLEQLKHFKCVISPDFSVYRDMPLAMQIFQVYKNRAASAFLEHAGIQIVPNVRWGDERTYEFAFEGIEPYGVVAVGVQGAYRDEDNATYFENGFIKMLDTLEPETVLCYGNLSESLKNLCELRNTSIVSYPTEISKWRKKERTDSMQLDLFSH